MPDLTKFDQFLTTGEPVRSLLLAFGQCFSALMVAALVGLAVFNLIQGALVVALLIGLVGPLYWAAMFVVFRATAEFLAERDVLGP